MVNEVKVGYEFGTWKMKRMRINSPGPRICDPGHAADIRLSADLVHHDTGDLTGFDMGGFAFGAAVDSWSILLVID